jgi:hypothetical protein
MSNPVKYRKKPVVIEAMQFDGTNGEEVAAWCGGEVESATCHGEGPPWLVMIRTLEGTMAAGRDDYVIRGVQGEFYPCKPDIFAATYEAADGDTSTISDGYHTFAELYEYRMLYNAHAAEGWAQQGKAVKSWRHSDGEECFGGGWFVVTVDLYPHGQVSNHYPAADWDLFHVPEVATAPEWDGHTPADAAQRLRAALTTEGASA